MFSSLLARHQVNRFSFEKAVDIFKRLYDWMSKEEIRKFRLENWMAYKKNYLFTDTLKLASHRIRIFGRNLWSWSWRSGESTAPCLRLRSKYSYRLSSLPPWSFSCVKPSPHVTKISRYHFDCVSIRVLVSFWTGVIGTHVATRILLGPFSNSCFALI